MKNPYYSVIFFMTLTFFSLKLSAANPIEMLGVPLVPIVSVPSHNYSINQNDLVYVEWKTKQLKQINLLSSVQALPDIKFPKLLKLGINKKYKRVQFSPNGKMIATIDADDNLAWKFLVKNEFCPTNTTRTIKRVREFFFYGNSYTIFYLTLDGFIYHTNGAIPKKITSLTNNIINHPLLDNLPPELRNEVSPSATFMAYKNAVSQLNPRSSNAWQIEKDSEITFKNGSQYSRFYIHRGSESSRRYFYVGADVDPEDCTITYDERFLVCKEYIMVENETMPILTVFALDLSSFKKTEFSQPGFIKSLYWLAFENLVKQKYQFFSQLAANRADLKKQLEENYPQKISSMIENQAEKFFTSLDSESIKKYKEWLQNTPVQIESPKVKLEFLLSNLDFPSKFTEYLTQTKEETLIFPDNISKEDSEKIKQYFYITAFHLFYNAQLPRIAPILSLTNCSGWTFCTGNFPTLGEFLFMFILRCESSCEKSLDELEELFDRYHYIELFFPKLYSVFFQDMLLNSSKQSVQEESECSFM